MGTVSVTADGTICQLWTDNTYDSTVIDANFPDGSVPAAQNFCRNPKGNSRSGPWCFIPPDDFGYCDIAQCPGDVPRFLYPIVNRTFYYDI